MDMPVGSDGVTEHCTKPSYLGFTVTVSTKVLAVTSVTVSSILVGTA